MARWALVAIALAVACGGPRQQVPMIGPASEIEALAGEWDGWYQADLGTRHGSIDFHLQAGSDTAVGDVIMIPDGWEEPVQPARSNANPSADVRPGPSMLRISFVRVGGGIVSGRLDPYDDPECGCELTTTFRGRIAGDTLKGTYVSIHGHGGPEVRGVWEAVRRRS